MSATLEPVPGLVQIRREHPQDVMKLQRRMQVHLTRVRLILDHLYTRDDRFGVHFNLALSISPSTPSAQRPYTTTTHPIYPQAPLERTCPKHVPYSDTGLVGIILGARASRPHPFVLSQIRCGRSQTPRRQRSLCQFGRRHHGSAGVSPASIRPATTPFAPLRVLRGQSPSFRRRPESRGAGTWGIPLITKIPRITVQTTPLTPAQTFPILLTVQQYANHQNLKP